MSITFLCDDVAFEDFVPFPDEPEYKERRPVAPFFRINLANGNATAFLSVLMPEKEYEYGGGSWGAGDLAKVLARATLLQEAAMGAVLVEPTLIEGGDGKCDVVHCGRDMAYLQRRYEEFAKLCALAIQHGKTISFG
jgi:hypothetical protein